MSDYSAHTYRKADPDCGKCKGRGITVEKFWEHSRAFMDSTITQRCPCTDIRPPTELEYAAKREIDP